jgi:hypothetical protein
MSWTNVIEEKDGSLTVNAVGEVQGIQAIVESALALPDVPKKEKKRKDTIIFPDPVNSPDHYTSGGIETIDFIEAKELDYNLGNVVKYITRAGKKNSKKLEDLKKARWYMNRAVENLEKA